MSCVKLLGTSDEPRKLFFTLLKAKQQRESTHRLLLEDGLWIEDEEEILKEVERFYNKLFHFVRDSPPFKKLDTSIFAIPQ